MADIPADTSLEDPATPEPATKTAVAKATKPRRRRGKLSCLTEMPLDVVIEVVMHLNPGDLLSLSRTTRNFREFLMRKSSAFLWKAARDNLEDYPPCPEDINEPALASFLYTNYCSNCLKPNVKWIYWDLRARYCKVCAEDLDKLLQKDVYLRDVLPGAPPEGMNVYGHIVHSYIPYHYLEYKHRPSYWGTAGSYFYRQQDVEQLQNALKERPEQCKAVLEEYRLKMRRIRECIDKMKTWHTHKLKARENELKCIRADRCEEIIARLYDLGWEEELRRITSSKKALEAFKDIPCVKEPRPLTERTWANIEETLEQWLEDTREKYINEERLRVNDERLRVLDRALTTICPRRPGEPSPADIALGIPEVRDVIERSPRETVEESDFDFLHDVLPSFRAQWRRDAEAYLGGLVRKQAGKIPEDVDPLSLAVATTFRCKLCHDIETYPELLSHTCPEHGFKPEDIAKEEDLYRRVVLRLFGKDDDYHAIREIIHWDPDLFGFSAEVGVMKRIVEMFGLDFRLATKADMDASPRRVVCKTCSDPGSVEAMDWVRTYIHITRYDDRGATKQLTKKEYMKWVAAGRDQYRSLGCYLVFLPDDLGEAARLLEHACDKEAVLSLEACDWACARCPLVGDHADCWTCPWNRCHGNRASVEQHLKEAHDIQTPDPDRDYYHSWDAPAYRIERPRVHLISEALRESERTDWAWQLELGCAAYVDLGALNDEEEPEPGPAEPEAPRPARSRRRQRRKKTANLKQ